MHSSALSLVALACLVGGAVASPALGFHGQLGVRPSSTTSTKTQHHHTRHQPTSTPAVILLAQAAAPAPLVDVNLLSNDPTKARLADVRIGGSGPRRRLSSRLFGKEARDTYYYRLGDGRVVKVLTHPSKPGYLLDVDVLGGNGHRDSNGGLLDIDLLRRRWTGGLKTARQFVTDPSLVEITAQYGSGASDGVSRQQQQSQQQQQQQQQQHAMSDDDNHSYKPQPKPNEHDSENKPQKNSYANSYNSNSNANPKPNHSYSNGNKGKPTKSNGKNGQFNAASTPDSTSSPSNTKIVHYEPANKHHKALIDVELGLLHLKRLAARYLRRNMDEVLGQKNVKMTAEVAAAKDGHRAVTGEGRPAPGAHVHGSVDDEFFVPGGIRQGAVKFPFYYLGGDDKMDSSTSTTTTSTAMTTTTTSTTHDALPTVFITQQHTGGSLIDLDLNLGHILRRQDEEDEDDEDCPMMDGDDDDASSSESAMPTSTAEARGEATFPPISFDTGSETSTSTSMPTPTPSSTNTADPGAMNVAASKPQSGSQWSGSDRRPTAYEPQAAMNFAPRPAGAMDFAATHNFAGAVVGKPAQSA